MEFVWTPRTRGPTGTVIWCLEKSARRIDVLNHNHPAGYYAPLMRVAPDHKDIGRRMRGMPMPADLLAQRDEAPEDGGVVIGMRTGLGGLRAVQ